MLNDEKITTGPDDMLRAARMDVDYWELYFGTKDVAREFKRNVDCVTVEAVVADWMQMTNHQWYTNGYGVVQCDPYYYHYLNADRSQWEYASTYVKNTLLGGYNSNNASKRICDIYSYTTFHTMIMYLQHQIDKINSALSTMGIARLHFAKSGILMGATRMSGAYDLERHYHAT